MKLEFPKNVTLLAIFGALFVVIPFLPYSVTVWADNIFIRLFLLIVFLAGLWINPILGLIILLDIGILFITRNKSKIDILRAETSIANDTSEAVQSIVTPETAPPMPEYEEAGEQKFEYAPQEDSGSNHFEPVGESIDTKVAPEPAISNSSYKAMKQLFGDIQPLAQDDQGHDTVDTDTQGHLLT